MAENTDKLIPDKDKEKEELAAYMKETLLRQAVIAVGGLLVSTIVGYLGYTGRKPFRK